MSVVVNPTLYETSHPNFNGNKLSASLIQDEVISSFLHVKAVSPSGSVGYLTLQQENNGTWKVSFNSANGLFFTD